MTRLPTLNGDFNSWGDILNSYLLQGQNADGTLKTSTVSQLLMFSNDGAVLSGTGNKRLLMPGPGTISAVVATLGTTPSGIAVIFDVLKNGTTIFTTQANRPSISPGSNVSSTVIPDVTAFAQGDYFRVDTSQVGSGPSGGTATVQAQVTFG